jgi:hypothetical protein
MSPPLHSLYVRDAPSRTLALRPSSASGVTPWILSFESVKGKGGVPVCTARFQAAEDFGAFSDYRILSKTCYGCLGFIQLGQGASQHVCRQSKIGERNNEWRKR